MGLFFVRHASQLYDTVKVIPKKANVFEAHLQRETQRFSEGSGRISCSKGRELCSDDKDETYSSTAEECKEIINTSSSPNLEVSTDHRHI